MSPLQCRGHPILCDLQLYLSKAVGLGPVFPPTANGSDPPKARDQDKDLKAAVDEVLHALRGELSMERSKKADYSRGQDQQALKEVGVDLLISLFRTEYRTPQRQTPQAPPFGRILVAVGPKGVPNGLKVLNISSMARAEGTSELIVEKRLVTQQGKLLLTPKAFDHLMAWLASEVLAGNINLPYHPHGANTSDPRWSANYTTS